MHDPSDAGSLLVTVAESNTGECHRIFTRVSLGVQYYSRFPLLERVLCGYLSISRWQKGLQAASQVDVRPMTKTSDGVQPYGLSFKK